jgi:hypothetical protein
MADVLTSGEERRDASRRSDSLDMRLQATNRVQRLRLDFCEGSRVDEPLAPAGWAVGPATLIIIASARNVEARCTS